jgi:hypothetical protein
MMKTESQTELHKKSINDLRYYLQVYTKKMRSALISKNFEESNLSLQLSYGSHNSLRAVGMRGGKLQHRQKFRKTKFIEVSEIGCIEPQNEFKAANNGAFKARNNKPNLMYNLNLFRKKYSKEGHLIKINTHLSNTHPVESVSKNKSSARRLLLLKTEQNR